MLNSWLVISMIFKIVLDQVLFEVHMISVPFRIGTLGDFHVHLQVFVRVCVTMFTEKEGMCLT